MTSLPNDARALVQQGWSHLELQRPLAAWAAWQQALRVDPGDRAASEALERLASAFDLPAAARATYRFREPRGDDRRRAWDQALRGRDLQILDAAADAFAAIIAEEPGDAPAHYNHALCLAWLGLNADAIASLDDSVRLDAADHFDEATDAWILAAVLRQGAGAEFLADDFDHALILSWTPGDPDPTARLTPGTLRAVAIPTTGPAHPESLQVFEWLDRPMPEPAAVRSHEDLPQVLATLLRTRETLRIASPRAAGLRSIEDFLGDDLPAEEHLDRRSTPLPLALLDAAVWTFRMPAGLDEPTRARLTREAVEHFYESDWITRPRPSLDGTAADSTPAGAARSAARGDVVAKVKLTAAVRFREQLGERPVTAALYAGYPFDRLRNRLGLEPIDPSAVDRSDPSCLNPTQLRDLDPRALETSALAEALQSARLFGINDLVTRFDLALSTRRTSPPDPED